MSDYEIRTVALVVNKNGCEIFDDSATRVEIVDEAAGEFVEVRQSASMTNGLIGITKEEWPLLREAIDRLISECRESPE